MAKLKLRVPTLDGLPKELTSFYRQMEGGGFVIDHEDDPDGYGIDKLPAIRGKLSEKERDLERLNAKLQRFAKPDGTLYTVEELQALTAQNSELAQALATLKDKSKTDEQKLGEMVSQAKKPLETELAKFKAERETYRSRVIQAEKAKLIAKATSILKPLPEWTDAIEDAIARRLDIREKDGGEFEHLIVEDGKPRMSGLMGNDGPMRIDEFVKSGDFRTKYGKYLAGDGKKGADITAPNEGANRQQQVGERDIRLSFDQAKDFKAYEAAKAEAAKRGGQVILEPFPTTSGGGAANG
jgi:DNA repair exonuclease SbcCD ATPase subunit